MADNCGLLSENLWFANYLWNSATVSSQILTLFFKPYKSESYFRGRRTVSETERKKYHCK